MTEREKDPIIHLPFFSEDECQECIEYAHKKEKELKNIDIEDPMKIGEHRSTTNYYYNYNFFIDNPQYIEKLKKTISFLFSIEEYPLFVQSWINIYRKNDYIPWHTHGVSDDKISKYTANIFLGGDENIGLTYAIHDKKNPRYHYKNIKNKLGHIMIFPNTLHHMVRKNPTENVRYTIGMTITPYHGHLAKVYLNNAEDLLLIPYSEEYKNKKSIFYQ